MKKLLLLGLFLGCLESRAATRTAASVSLTDVRAAYAACNNGDILAIPAGSATWTDYLFVEKQITIRGAGAYLTTITASNPGNVTIGGFGYRPAFYFNWTIQGPWRLRDVGINGSRNANGVLYVGDNPGRVDHCYLEDCRDRGVQCYGVNVVLDHNTFKNCFAAWSAYNNETTAWNAWQDPKYLGTTNQMIAEDNYILVTGAWYTPIISDNGDGIRATHRYNTLTNLLSSFDYAFDAHGNQGSPFPNGGIRGTISQEDYNNNLYLNSANRANVIRGGNHIHFGNRYYAGAGNLANGSTVYYMFEEDGFRPGNPIVTKWPPYDSITNSYFWAETFNNIPTGPGNVFKEQPSDYVLIQENRDYFFKAPSTNYYRPLRYPHPRILTDNDPPVPQPFLLTAPLGATTTTPTFTWTPSSSATGYKLEVASDFYFTTLLFSTTVGTATNFTVNSGILATNTSYFWRVLANGSNGNTYSGSFTDAHIGTFTTSNPNPPPPPPTVPNTPTNIYPALNAINIPISASLKLSPYIGGTPQQGALFIFMDGGGNVLQQSGLLGVVDSFKPTNITYNTTYSYSGAYSNVAGLSGFSQRSSFTTAHALAPNRPAITSPINGASGQPLSPTFTATAFSDPQGAAFLAVRWFVQQGNTVIYDSKALAPATTLVYPGQLMYNTTYTVFVQYENQYLEWSQISVPIQFTTANYPPPNAPSILVPTNGTPNVDVLSQYQITSSAYSGLLPWADRQFILKSGDTVIFDSGWQGQVTNFFVPINTLSYSTLYTVQARDRNNQDVASPYGAAVYFATTNAPPPPVIPVPPVTTNNVTIILQSTGALEIKGVWISR